MAVTGLDSNLTTRGNFAIIAIAKYAVGKLRDGDKKCHDELMLVVDRIKNLVYALDSDSLTDAIEDEDIYCLHAALFKLIQDHSYIDGIVPPSQGDTAGGIGNMSITNGIGDIFQIY